MPQVSGHAGAVWPADRTAATSMASIPMIVTVDLATLVGGDSSATPMAA